MHEDFELLGLQVFKIDFNKNTCEDGVSRITDIDDTNDFGTFLKDQFFNIMINETYKSFKYNPESLTIQLIEKALKKEDIDANALSIANNLWSAEYRSNERNKKTLKNELLKGNLIIAQLKYHEALHSIIIKMGHINIFQDGNYRKKSGVPEEKSILKSFYISYKNIDTTLEAYKLKIKDPSSTVFWKRSFLDVQEEFTSEKNVKECFEYLTKKISFKFSKHPDEKDKLLNSTQYYFYTNENFDLDDYLEKIIVKHTTKSDKIKISEFSDKLKKDIEKNRKFDTYFSLRDVGDIESKLKPLEYKIKDGITIKIAKTNNNDISDIFESVTYNGKKAIAIYNPDNNIFDYYLRKISK